MRFKFNIYILLSLAFLVGCTDDFPREGIGDYNTGKTVEAYLTLNVDDFSVDVLTRDAEPSKTPEKVTEAEKRIKDIWVFQYALTGEALQDAIYKTVSSEQDLEDIVHSGLKVELTEGNSKICIVANTSDPEWGKAQVLKDYTGLKNYALSKPEPIFLSELESGDKSIPMEGEKEALVGEFAKIQIDVVRMYAKLKIGFGQHGSVSADGKDLINPKSIQINNIPYYCRVNTLGDGLAEASAYSYADDVTWITRSFDATKEGADAYVIYVPENIQGEVNNTEGKDKGEIAPKNAMKVNLLMTNGYYVEAMDNAFFEEDVNYYIYPGGNVRNNFNVRRNNVYRLKTTIKSVDVHNPSSNCFVVEPGKNLTFEPYYRTETGGMDGTTGPNGDDIFKMETYMTPNDPDKTIASVRIIWQNKDVIGDNTKDLLVHYIVNEKEPEHSKIYVKTNEKGVEGNALVGAFNSVGKILWSWHIWVTNGNPTNVGNAVVYKTYDWDKNGIKVNQPRIPGYAVMSRNLGALADEPVSANMSDIAKTHGMLYQWGRKDPFPPMILNQWGDHDYTDKSTGYHYGNNNELIIPKTGWDEDALNYLSGNNNYDTKEKFYSILANDGAVINAPIQYSIANPCVFICGTKEIKVGGEHEAGASTESDPDKYNQKSESYLWDGDWMNPDHKNNKLWGGLDPDKAGMEFYKIDLGGGDYAQISRNYGTEKSLFDPCPAGWRVPPGDLWLGFTRTGENPEIIENVLGLNENVNFDIDKTGTGITPGQNGYKGGMYMYIRDSKFLNGTTMLKTDFDKTTLFFPSQGSREGSGNCLRVTVCGNYHNATADLNNKINILHVHNSTAFKLFESFYSYTRKSQATNIRCVRDTK